MLQQPKNHPCKEDLENKLLIEKWMKRNSTNSVTIGQDIIGTDNINTINNVSTKRDLTINSIELCVSHTKVVETGLSTATSSEISNNKSSKVINKKRSYNTSLDDVELSISKTKILRKSLPITNTELQSFNRSILKKKTDTDYQTQKTLPSISKSASCSIELMKNSAKKTTANQNMKTESIPVIQCHIAKSTPSKLSGAKSIEHDLNIKIETDVASCKKISNVYTSLLDNYQYLITPKSWSASESMIDVHDRCLVFFNTQIVKENDTLISVMKKSLIIDKEATMHYSVYGLPVDIKGTILPRALDNTKKLLSILHIFDKMQVCDGLGLDLSKIPNEFVFKDSCRSWRHKNCKIVLIKATRCPICIETRNDLLDSTVKHKKNPISSIQLMDVKIKKEKCHIKS